MAQKFLLCAGLQADVRLFAKKRRGYPTKWTINDKDAKKFSSEEIVHKYVKDYHIDCSAYGVVDAKEPYARLPFYYITPKY